MSRERWEMSEESFWDQFDHREVDVYGNYPGETSTHKYPLLPTGRIMKGNEPINWKWKPF